MPLGNRYYCKDARPAIQVTLISEDGSEGKVAVRVFNFAPSWDAAKELATQRQLNSVLDLSNGSISEAG